MKFNNPWLIAAIGCIVLVVSNGMAVNGLSVFDESLLKEFGWSRGELKFGGMITFGVGSLLAPFGGIIVDRIGVKKCMLVGWLILILAYLGYGQIGSLTHLYLVHALLGIVLVFCGLNSAIIMVSSWFITKRGVAVGITLVGTSLGGVLFPQYGTAMIEAYGWRQAFQWAAIFPLIMFFVVLFIVQNKPESNNESTVDKTEQEENNPTGMNDDSLTYIEAIKTRAFWALSIVAMTTFYTVLGVQANLFLYLRDLEMSASTATNAISVFFVCAMIGKLVFGYLADYIHFRKVFTSNIVVMLIGSVCLALMNDSLIWVAIILFGLGWGGVYTTLQLSAVNCFGLKSAGKILGTIAVLDCLGGGLGIWLTGLFYSKHGDYQFAFIVFCVLVTIALLLVSFIRKPEKVMIESTSN